MAAAWPGMHDSRSWQRWAGKEIPSIFVFMRNQSDGSPSEHAMIRVRSRKLSRKGGMGLDPTVTPHFVLPAPDRHLTASPAAPLPFCSFTPILVLLSPGQLHPAGSWRAGDKPEPFLDRNREPLCAMGSPAAGLFLACGGISKGTH